MHELSVVSSLVEIVQEEALQHGASRVVEVNLVIGERASILDESLFFYFDMLTPGTLAEGAKLTAKRIPSEFICLECGKAYLAEADLRCSYCGGMGRLSEKGSEFYIDSIEIEKEE